MLVTHVQCTQNSISRKIINSIMNVFRFPLIGTSLALESFFGRLSPTLGFTYYQYKKTRLLVSTIEPNLIALVYIHDVSAIDLAFSLKWKLTKIFSVLSVFTVYQNLIWGGKVPCSITNTAISTTAMIL